MKIVFDDEMVELNVVIPKVESYPEIVIGIINTDNGYSIKVNGKVVHGAKWDDLEVK